MDAQCYCKLAVAVVVRLHRRLCHVDHFLLVLLHLDPVRPERASREHEEIWWIHSGDSSWASDRDVPQFCDESPVVCRFDLSRLHRYLAEYRA